MTDVIVEDVAVPTKSKITAARIEANCSPSGARYHGQNDIARNRISNLVMSSRADEIRPDLSTATLGSTTNRGIKS
jgi:hypothetical protein